jgi:hypothetical protein
VSEAKKKQNKRRILRCWRPEDAALKRAQRKAAFLSSSGLSFFQRLLLRMGITAFSTRPAEW